MAQFKAFEAGMQVTGAAIMSVLAGMGSFQNLAMSFLRRRGL